MSSLAASATTPSPAPNTDATFIYAPGDGADTITNFGAGGTLGRIDLSWVSTVGSLANINAVTTDTAGGAKIDFGSGNSITLTGVVESSLTADDFIFHGTTGRTFEGGAIDNTWLVLHSNIDPLTNVRGDGGTGTDTFHLDVSNQANTLTSGIGNDTGTGSFGANTAFYKLSTGRPSGIATSRSCRLPAAAGADNFGGSALNDILNGAGGADILNGLAGNDAITGGDAVDTLNGGVGDDFVSGGAGDDILRGDVGYDALDGGDGNDTLDGGATPTSHSLNRSLAALATTSSRVRTPA